jgi:hypothetical protein
MPKVRLLFHPYMRGEPEWHEVDATVRGDLAIHKWGMLHGPGDLRFSKSFTVSHIPTGTSVSKALPRRFDSRALKRDLVAWAEAFQERCSRFFDACRVNDTETMRRLAPGAYDAGRLL